MKEFNLEAALAGQPVCTRDGRPVKIAGYNPDADKQYAVIAWVEGKGRAYNIDGTIGFMELKSDDQLFMAEKPKVKREGWVNIYKKGMQPYHTLIFATKEKANANKDGVCVIDTVKIEWEEEAE